MYKALKDITLSKRNVIKSGDVIQKDANGFAKGIANFAINNGLVRILNENELKANGVFKFNGQNFYVKDDLLFSESYGDNFGVNELKNLIEFMKNPTVKIRLLGDKTKVYSRSGGNETGIFVPEKEHPILKWEVGKEYYAYDGYTDRFEIGDIIVYQESIMDMGICFIKKESRVWLDIGMKRRGYWDHRAFSVQDNHLKTGCQDLNIERATEFIKEIISYMEKNR